MIGSSENRVSYNGNGNAKEFAFEFKILNASDIKVLLVNADGTEKLLTKDYFVDIEKSVVRYPGYAPGAELPLEQQPPILPTGSKLVLYREVPITQQTKLDQFWPFNVIEAALDKLTIICQQLSDGFSRCLKLSESVPKDVNPTIPVEAGKSFRWSDDGKKIVLTDDPAKVLPQANEVLKRTEAARDVAVAKADAAGASAVSAAESEIAADRSAAQAEAAKVAAKASEVAAKASQDAAKVSETKAKTSETNALTHENNAKASADKAKVSETNAKSSETIATTKASEASVSAEKAKASEVAAKASQAAAKVSETNAKTSEGKAKTSETNAKTSETNAANSASTATTKASEASLSATNAKTSETNAGKSASAASASQTAAKASETSAANSASTATAKASEASASATKAKTSETTATQQATKATTEANRAKTEADRAKTAADSVGNPVVDVVQSGSSITITKGDGSNSSISLPEVDTRNMAKLDMENTFRASNTFNGDLIGYGELFIKDANQGNIPIFTITKDRIGINLYRSTEIHEQLKLKKSVNEYISMTQLDSVATDVVELKVQDSSFISISPNLIWGTNDDNTIRICVLLITGAGAPTIQWNCTPFCDAPTKEANKSTIVSFLAVGSNYYLVSFAQEVPPYDS